MAQSNWCKKENLPNIPSYNENLANDQEAQKEIIEAIQLEQNRVYKQDLQLLQNYNSSQEEGISSIGGNPETGRDTKDYNSETREEPTIYPMTPEETNRAQEEPYDL